MTAAAFAGSSAANVFTLKRVLVAGLAAGALDAVYFSIRAIVEGRTPASVLRSIASFWLDKSAFTSVVAAPVLGAATHFALATFMAAGFAGIAQLAPGIRTKPIIAGAAYGLLLYCIMYLLVLPARWPKIYPRFDGASSLCDMLLHVVFGIVIAWVITPRPAFRMPTAP